MLFRDIRHQERAVSILRRSLFSGRTHHAYLFDGPEGVGKELAARALAARLLCETATEDVLDACGQCRSCSLFAAGAHVDFHLIHRGLHKLHPDPAIRASKGLTLAVDVIRHFLIQPAANSPALGKARVFIVRDAERMNEGAQNALLKTLEEPPRHVRLILITSAADRLLPTIRSRCQRVQFDRLPRAFVVEHLAQAGVAPPEAELLAELADGRLGAALHWRRIELAGVLSDIDAALADAAYDDPESFAKRMIESATELARRSAAAESEDDATPDGSPASDAGPQRGASPAQKIETDPLRDALKLVLMMAAALLRRALIAPYASGSRGDDSPMRSTGALRARLDEDTLLAGIDAVKRVETMLDRNVAPQLACERLATALSGDAPVI